MAIFRGGKRIGPFDIRLGFPRDRSMENIDNDPRLRQRANAENTIGRFRAAMAKSNGYARPARFAVRIFPPVALRKIIQEIEETPVAAGTSEEADKRNDKVNRAPTSKTMSDLSQTLGRQINIHCDSVSMPGKDLQTQTVQYGSAPEQDLVTGHGYGGQINASFYADSFLRERHFFEAWQRMIVGEHTHKANYYDNYIGKMHIYQLGSDSEVNRDMPTYAIEAMDVYPATIGAVELGYSKANEIATISIEFAYKSWRNMATEPNGIDFGHAMQTAADVKARTPGLFGRLPPSLQRAGKDIFNQGRTVFNPIGRIFKGKVFPPFT